MFVLRVVRWLPWGRERRQTKVLAYARQWQDKERKAPCGAQH